MNVTHVLEKYFSPLVMEEKESNTHNRILTSCIILLSHGWEWERVRGEYTHLAANPSFLVELHRRT
jgi:hypothetical protein